MTPNTSSIRGAPSGTAFNAKLGGIASVSYTTNQEAREYFKDKGLTYSDISEGDILVLTMMVQKELKAAYRDGGLDYPLTLSPDLPIMPGKDGGIVSCFLKLNAPGHWKGREAISFNRDGFIGFAGWADSQNTAPIIRAFLSWCDYLANSKGPSCANGGRG